MSGFSPRGQGVVVGAYPGSQVPSSGGTAGQNSYHVPGVIGDDGCPIGGSIPSIDDLNAIQQALNCILTENGTKPFPISCAVDNPCILLNKLKELFMVDECLDPPKADANACSISNAVFVTGPDGCIRLMTLGSGPVILGQTNIPDIPQGTSVQWPLASDNVGADYYHIPQLRTDIINNSIDRDKLNRYRVACFPIDLACETGVEFKFQDSVAFDPANVGTSSVIYSVNDNIVINPGNSGPLRVANFTNFDSTVEGSHSITLPAGQHDICMYIVATNPAYPMAAINLDNKPGIDLSPILSACVATGAVSGGTPSNAGSSTTTTGNNGGTAFTVDQDNLSTDECTQVTGNVLTNDAGTDLSVTKFEFENFSTGVYENLALGSSVSTSNGMIVQMNSNGSFTIDPNNAFNLASNATATTRFRVTVTDGNGDIKTSLIVLNVTDCAQITSDFSMSLPASPNLSLTMTSGENEKFYFVEGMQSGNTVLVNITDINGSSTYPVLLAGTSSNGLTATRSSQDVIQLNRTGGYVGNASFTVTGQSPNGSTDTITITVNAS